MKWFHWIFIPMWVFESLTAMGYEACDPLLKGFIQCENPWEVALFQYEKISDPETHEIVRVIQIITKKEKRRRYGTRHNDDSILKRNDNSRTNRKNRKRKTKEKG